MNVSVGNPLEGFALSERAVRVSSTVTVLIPSLSVNIVPLLSTVLTLSSAFKANF